MIVYCLILLFGIIFYNENRIAYKLLFSITLLLLGIFRGITVGTDFSTYQRTFDQRTFSTFKYDFDQIILSFNSENTLSRQLEPFWYALNYSVNFIGANYSLVNFASLLIVLCVYIFTFITNSKNSSFSILLLYAFFYYFMTFNITRQSIAISFVLLFYSYFCKKKWIYATITLLIAIGFHFSSVFSLIILIPIIKINKTFSYYLLMFSLFFGSLFSEYLINLFTFKSIYNFYVEFKWKEIDILVLVVFHFLQGLLFYFTTKNIKTKYLVDNYTKIWFFGLILQNIFIKYVVFHRVFEYFLVAQLIAIPFYLPKKLSFVIFIQNKKLLIILILIILIFAFNIFFNRQGVIPYEIMGT